MKLRTLTNLVATAALLGGEMAHAAEGFEHPSVLNGMRTYRRNLVYDNRSTLAGLDHSHIEEPEMIDVTNSISASGTASSRVEGSLDIRWENYGSAAAPKYRVLFLRYDSKFKGGAQQPKWFEGTGALETYLLELGFAPEDAKNWIKQVHAENRSVPITHVMMPERYVADYRN
jgi:hypothetical protein